LYHNGNAMTPTPSLPKSPGSTARIRLEGILDVVKASDSSFSLQLADGRSIPGCLVGRPITSLARVLGRHLLVFGTGHYGTTGELERIEADSFIPNDGKPWGISTDDLPFSEEVKEEQARRLRAVMGMWPGDETDEQINAALEELS
jgi:hypothetical protein